MLSLSYNLPLVLNLPILDLSLRRNAITCAAICRAPCLYGPKPELLELASREFQYKEPSIVRQPNPFSCEAPLTAKLQYH